MIVKFDKLINSVDELKEFDRTNPYNVVGILINVISSYDIEDDSNFINELQYLMGEFQPISTLMRQSIKDRMKQNDKYEYIGKSYFKGATPSNDYTPDMPYEIEITSNKYSQIENGFMKLFVNSGGADSARGITVRLAKDGNYYVWSDSFMGLLADVRGLESKNPWA